METTGAKVRHPQALNINKPVDAPSSVSKGRLLSCQYSRESRLRPVSRLTLFEGRGPDPSITTAEPWFAHLQLKPAGCLERATTL